MAFEMIVTSSPRHEHCATAAWMRRVLMGPATLPRVQDTVELEGLDEAELGETAYDLT